MFLFLHSLNREEQLVWKKKKKQENFDFSQSYAHVKLMTNYWGNVKQYQHLGLLLMTSWSNVLDTIFKAFSVVLNGIKDY